MSDNSDDMMDDLEGIDGDTLDDFDDVDDFGEGGDGDNPLMKIAMIGAAFVAIVGGIMLFGGDKQAPLQSSVKSRDFTEAPGLSDVTEDYAERVAEQNEKVVEKAIQEGTSAMPRPISTPSTTLSLAEDDSIEEDPLDRWRRIQEERQRQELESLPQQKKTSASGEVIENLAKAMSSQMASVIQYVQPGEMTVENVADNEDLEAYFEELAEEAEEANGEGEGGVDNTILNVLIPAGKIEYAQLLTEANSDAPGPVLAHLVSGPLQGSRLIGDFSVENDEYLVLTFDTIVIDGISYDTEAVALDPDTANPGMVSEVDHRYFKRIFLPAAAAFITGYAEAVAETGQETTAVGDNTATQTIPEPDATEELFSGIEEAANIIGEFMEEEADNTEVLVKVNQGTPMGVLFTQPVAIEEEAF
jgi:intracellular multiplication protein IcmE